MSKSLKTLAVLLLVATAAAARAADPGPSLKNARLTGPEAEVSAGSTLTVKGTVQSSGTGNNVADSAKAGSALETQINAAAAAAQAAAQAASQPHDTTLDAISGQGTTGTGAVVRATSPTFAGSITLGTFSVTATDARYAASGVSAGITPSSVYYSNATKYIGLSSSGLTVTNSSVTEATIDSTTGAIYSRGGVSTDSLLSAGGDIRQSNTSAPSGSRNWVAHLDSAGNRILYPAADDYTLGSAAMTVTRVGNVTIAGWLNVNGATFTLSGKLINPPASSGATMAGTNIAQTWTADQRFNGRMGINAAAVTGQPLTIYNTAGTTQLWSLDDSGNVTVAGNITVNGTNPRMPNVSAMADGKSIANRDSGDARWAATIADFDYNVTTASGATGGSGSWTWTIPGGTHIIEIDAIGAGGGGGSGRRGASGTNRYGGGGGASGGWTHMTCVVANLPTSTLSVTIGAGGAGGTAVATDDTNGATGSAGGVTKVMSSGVTICAMNTAGNQPGNGGTTSAGGGGTWPAGYSTFALGSNGNSGQTGAGFGGNNANSCLVGGSGGAGLSATDTPASGGQGGTGMGQIFAYSTSAPGGVAPGGNGSDAVDYTSTTYGRLLVGGGGASGASNVGGPGGNGGAGWRGGGGGGGGASQNGYASGGGGKGGDGFVRITCY
jgi:hypothetical protein